MPMREDGLAKLTEEIGELGTIVGKMLQYPTLRRDKDRNHPSGYNLRVKMSEEMADVEAAIAYVRTALDLPSMDKRRVEKLHTFTHIYKENEDYLCSFCSDTGWKSQGDGVIICGCPKGMALIEVRNATGNHR